MKIWGFFIMVFRTMIGPDSRDIKTFYFYLIYIDNLSVLLECRDFNNIDKLSYSV